MPQQLPGGIGLPCGQVGGWPSSVQTESVASGERMCSSSQACVLHDALAEIEHVAEEPLGEPVPAHHVARPPLALLRQVHVHPVEPDEARPRERLEIRAARSGRVLGLRGRQDLLGRVAARLALGEGGLQDLLEPPRRRPVVHGESLLASRSRFSRSMRRRRPPASPASCGKL